MSDVNYLIDFFKHEANAGLDISKREPTVFEFEFDSSDEDERDHTAIWEEYAKVNADFAQRLQSNSDLAAFANYFKTVDFALKDILLETLEQDAERPDLAALLDESYAN